jgi:hypothetical protein
VAAESEDEDDGVAETDPELAGVGVVVGVALVAAPEAFGVDEALGCAGVALAPPVEPGRGAVGVGTAETLGGVGLG